MSSLDFQLSALHSSLILIIEVKVGILIKAGFIYFFMLQLKIAGELLKDLSQKSWRSVESPHKPY